MSARVTELESEIRRLTGQRDAQPPDTLYALTYQRHIDALSVELIAWKLDPARMRAAEDAIRAAGRRHRRAHTGRGHWPAVAAASGLLGSLATAGQLAADTSGPPLLGGALLTAAAAALALTAANRARDARDAAAAQADLDTAQAEYAAVVARHGNAIAPIRPLAVHNQQEETPCEPQPRPVTNTPATNTSTARSGPAAAVTGGHRPAVSGPSAPSCPTVAA